MKNNMKTFLRSTALGTSALCLMGSMAFAQNLIVDGSLCVGLDCLANESFGFDTIRMKENNLRLQFLDTSTAAAFPSADWRLIANDCE